jgi:hypothetical protein
LGESASVHLMHSKTSLNKLYFLRHFLEVDIIYLSTDDIFLCLG